MSRSGSKVEKRRPWAYGQHDSVSSSSCPPYDGSLGIDLHGEVEHPGLDLLGLPDQRDPADGTIGPREPRAPGEPNL